MIRGRILHVDLHDISVPGTEPRGVIDASLLAGDLPIRVLVTHFGLVITSYSIHYTKLYEGRKTGCGPVFPGHRGA